MALSVMSKVERSTAGADGAPLNENSSAIGLNATAHLYAAGPRTLAPNLSSHMRALVPSPWHACARASHLHRPGRDVRARAARRLSASRVRRCRRIDPSSSRTRATRTTLPRARATSEWMSARRARTTPSLPSWPSPPSTPPLPPSPTRHGPHAAATHTPHAATASDWDPTRGFRTAIGTTHRLSHPRLYTPPLIPHATRRLTIAPHPHTTGRTPPPLSRRRISSHTPLPPTPTRRSVEPAEGSQEAMVGNGGHGGGGMADAAIG